MKELAEEWVRKAEEDYRVSKVLLGTDEFPSSVAFHAQQCAEKYLKAFLVNTNVPPPRTHNLYKLNSECLRIDPEFEKFNEFLLFLDLFSTATRYPGINIDTAEARKGVEYAEKVREFIRRKLGIEQAR